MHQLLKSPIYAGAYAFGRTRGRTRIVDGRARKTGGHKVPITDWAVLLRDHHEGYITWEHFEENQRLLIREGKLPATQLMPWAPWKVPVEVLESETVQMGVQEIVARRPGRTKQLQDVKTLRLPGI